VVSGPTDSDPALAPAPDDPRSRRALLAGGGAAALGAAAVLSGCGSAAQKSNVPLTKHSPGAKHDVRILNHLLDLEYRAIYAYTASIPLLAAANRQNKKPHKKTSSTPVLPPSAKKKKPPAPLSTVPLLASNAAADFLSQEVDHSLELKRIIMQAGGRPVRPAPSYNVGNPSTKRELLMGLHSIEQAQLVAYLEAATVLTPGQLRAAAAAIFSNEAQHAMVLRMQLGLPAIPSPFVTGQE
jgi:hypothetical protein